MSMANDRRHLFFRLLIPTSSGVVGVGIGGAIGVGAAEGAEPLVGGAIVAISAIAGGGIAFCLGAFAAWKLPARRLSLTAWVLGAPALVLLILGLVGLWRIDQQTRDPEEAYAGLPVFVVVLERDPAHDPHLATRVEVNANHRRWITTLPDGRQCSGRLRAEVQRRVSGALPDADIPTHCRDQPARGAQERLQWQIAGGGRGAVLLDQACRSASPALARLGQVVSMASSLAASRVSCE